jgi:hypothetical protein
LSDQERCSGLDAILSSTLDSGKRSLTAKSVDAPHNAGIRRPFFLELRFAFAIHVPDSFCIATMRICCCLDQFYLASAFRF